MYKYPGHSDLNDLFRTIKYLLLLAHGLLLHDLLYLRTPLQCFPPVRRRTPKLSPRLPHLLLHVALDFPKVLHLIFPHLHAAFKYS